MSEERKVSSEQLRSMRDAFQQESRQKISDLNRLIAEAESAEAQSARDEALKAILPKDLDKSVLNGHDFVFLINKTKGMGNGPGSALGAAVYAAQKTHAATSGAEGLTIEARLWGNSAGGTIPVNLSDRNKVDNAAAKTPIDAQDIVALAREILMTNTPDRKRPGRKVHYIIMGDGNLAGDVSITIEILKAAWTFSQPTFDFVACTEKDGTPMQTLGEHSGLSTFTKVEKPAGVAEAVAGIIKRRLSQAAALAPQVSDAKTVPPLPAE